jgi:hypothetical protein
MKTPRRLALFSAFALLPAISAWAASGKITSDLVVPAKRQEIVDKATHLTRPPVPAPVPANLNPPFNPNGFDVPDADEAGPAIAGGPGAKSAAPVKPAGPVGDRELLEAMAPRIQPTGSFIIGGNPLLTFPGAKRVRVGDVLQVIYNEKEYELEVTAIDRTNFTLRFRGEEITRPIAKTTK